MAIVKMSKFSLFAFQKDKAVLLENLQKFEGVQFINLQGKLEEEVFSTLTKDSEELITSDLESEQVKIKFALDFLRTYIPKEKGMKVMMQGMRTLTYDALITEARLSDYLKVYEQVKDIDQRLNFLKAEILRLETEIIGLNPWHSFDVPLEKLKALVYSKAIIGLVPNNLKMKFMQEIQEQLKTVYIESVSETREGAHFLIIVHNTEQTVLEEILKKYGFAQSTIQLDGLCQDQIKANQNMIARYETEMQLKIVEIGNFKEEVPKLEVGYEYLSSELSKVKSSTHFLKTERMLVIEGWVTQDNSKVLEDIVKGITRDHYHLEFVEANELDDVPILLKNNGLVTPFESFISMYGLPKYNGIDPTLSIVPFYMLFYGLMLSDFFYGLIQFVACVFVLTKFKLNTSTRNMIKLFMYLSIPTMFVGILYGSYFSGAIPIPPIWIDPTKNVILILVASFGMGLIHIFTGLGIKAYMLIRDGKVLDAFFDVGLWVITLVSSIILVGVSFAKITSLDGILPIAKYGMIAGMVGLVLTQGRSAKGIGGKLGGGLYGLYGITGYIGDIVSYSRLMALGLATSFIGGAFNSMIDLLGHGISAWIFGPIIFIIGHMFNLFINALGGYVHSLRLQYLEFFGKFYESGGKPFVPFKTKSKYINIVKN